MSMINDALKRAKETQSSNPPTGAPPLPPVESRPGGNAGWILLAIVVVAVIGFLAVPHLFKQESAPPPAMPMTNAPVPVAAPVETNAPVAVAPVVEPEPKVQGILFDTVKPMAIVNGKAVHVGDRVGNYKVTAISRGSVTLLGPDGTSKEIKFGK